MNEKTLSRLYAQQSNLTRRLLSCIPSDDMIHVRDILTRAKQLEQPILDGNIIKTQLRSLCSVGLIRAMDSQHYKRENFSLTGEVTRQPLAPPTLSAPVNRSGMTVREEQLTGELKALKREAVVKDQTIDKLQGSVRIHRQTITELEAKVRLLERMLDAKETSIPVVPVADKREPKAGIVHLTQSGDRLETIEDGKGVPLPNVAAANSPEYRAWNNILARRSRVRPDGIPDFETFIQVVGYRPSERSRMVQTTLPNGSVEYGWRQGSIATPGLRYAPANWPNNN